MLAACPAPVGGHARVRLAFTLRIRDLAGNAASTPLDAGVSPRGSGGFSSGRPAAHPMYPIGANDGSQAIIDARVLAYSLARAATPADGLAAYEMTRREKTSPR